MFVKYAVRYKDADETVAIRAWPLAGSTAADALESEPIAVDETTVTADAPARPALLDPPSWLAEAGAKAIEKALRERLPDKLALTLFQGSR